MTHSTIERHPLLGADFDDVRARYGVPLACVSRGGMLHFTYPGDRSGIDAAVVVSDGVVVRIDPTIREAPPATGTKALFGARAEEAIARFGPARRVLNRGNACALEFAAFVAFVLDERIVGVRDFGPVTATG